MNALVIAELIERLIGQQPDASDADIAVLYARDPKNYPAVARTQDELVNDITAAGGNGVAIVDAIIAKLENEESRTMQGKLEKFLAGEPIDMGNPIIRQRLQQAGEDAANLLQLYPVTMPTVADVAQVRYAIGVEALQESARQLGQRVQQAGVIAAGQTDATMEIVKAAMSEAIG